MYKIEFWKAAFERSVSTFFQTFLGVWLALGITTTSGLDWRAIFGAAGAAAVLSVLKSVVAGFDGGGPSIGNVEKVTYENYPDGQGD